MIKEVTKWVDTETGDESNSLDEAIKKHSIKKILGLLIGAVDGTESITIFDRYESMGGERGTAHRDTDVAEWIVENFDKIAEAIGNKNK